MLLTSHRRKANHQRRPAVGRLGIAATSLLAIVMVTVAACSNSSDTPSASARNAAGAPTLEEIETWFPEIIDAMQPCDSASLVTVGAINAYVVRASGANSDADLVAAAGNAFEQCESSATPALHPDELTGLPASMQPLVDLASAWLNAMAAANREALIAAAGNLDNRIIVSSAIDRQTDANAANDAFDRLVREYAESLGVTIPADQHLVRWVPPEYP